MRWLLMLHVLLAGAEALAVPAFARRYGTSCQTCHVAFPKLTPFGEAFRRNGHHFPGGRDEDYRRSEPQKLGADAYRDVFPRAVWPGLLPKEIPFSAFLTSTIKGSPTGPARADFGSLGGQLGINAAASLGQWLSAWFGVTIMGTTGESAAVAIERAFVVLSPFKKPHTQLRIGRMEPGVLSISSHKPFGLSPWLLTTPVGDNQFALEPTQLGLELTGVLLGGRATYSLGFVEGAGNQLNTPKDVYARLAYKVGGMRLDGDAGGGELNLAEPAPWREWSVLIGGFVYAGFAEIGDPARATQDDRFIQAGGEINAQLKDANLMLAYAFGTHRRPLIAAPLQGVRSHHLFAQLDYVVFPWLIPTLRYERRAIDGHWDDRFFGGLYVLLRANVRVVLLAAAQRLAQTAQVKLERVQGSLAVGF